LPVKHTVLHTRFKLAAQPMNTTENGVCLKIPPSFRPFVALQGRSQFISGSGPREPDQ
jgi:hypothetical protein